MERIKLNNIPLNAKTIPLILQAKAKDIEIVYTTYECTKEEAEELIIRKLSESNMHLGAGNMAIDFLIEQAKQGKTRIMDTIQKALAEQILGAAICYANVLGLDPVYKS